MKNISFNSIFLGYNDPFCEFYGRVICLGPLFVSDCTGARASVLCLQCMSVSGYLGSVN
uniref:Uncharacterized protein n=1 Tax=Anguilla anguilla TaxID=7936 RepID=A0A0E9T1I2_ANGAN